MNLEVPNTFYGKTNKRFTKTKTSQREERTHKSGSMISYSALGALRCLQSGNWCRNPIWHRSALIKRLLFFNFISTALFANQLPSRRPSATIRRDHLLLAAAFGKPSFALETQVYCLPLCRTNKPFGGSPHGSTTPPRA